MVNSKGWAMDSRSDGGPARKRREAMCGIADRR
jgi:hypothetical protein